MFYHRLTKGKYIGTIKGFPMVKGNWCTKLKTEKVDLQGYLLSHPKKRKKERANIRISNVKRSMVYRGTQTASAKFYFKHPQQGADINIVQYLGIASDEPKRIERHQKRENVILPLVDIGWDEAYCRKWCDENNLLSPIYTTATRGGCWFCHNQSIDELRLTRKQYPEYWELLLKWDADSPVTFKADGHTVHDFDKRFDLEDKGLIPTDNTFRWWMIEQYQLKLF